MSDQYVLDVQLDRAGRTLTVWMAGSFDQERAAEFDEVAAAAIDETTDTVHVDLSGVTYCDSSGLRALAAVAGHCERIGARLTLRDPTPNTRRILEVTGLLGTLNVQGTAVPPSPEAGPAGPLLAGDSAPA